MSPDLLVSNVPCILYLDTQSEHPVSYLAALPVGKKNMLCCDTWLAMPHILSECAASVTNQTPYPRPSHHNLTKGMHIWNVNPLQVISKYSHLPLNVSNPFLKIRCSAHESTNQKPLYHYYNALRQPKIPNQFPTTLTKDSKMHVHN